MRIDLSSLIASAPAGSTIRVEILRPRAPADPTTTIAKLRKTAGIAAYANRGEDVTAADEAEFFHHAVDQAERMAIAGPSSSGWPMRSATCSPRRYSERSLTVPSTQYPPDERYPHAVPQKL